MRSISFRWIAATQLPFKRTLGFQRVFTINKYSHIVYLALVALCSIIVNLYIVSLGTGGTVNELTSIAGPTIATYLLGKSGWVDVYGLTLIIGLVICGVLWVAASKSSVFWKMGLSALCLMVWLGSGIFLMAVSFHG